MTARFLVDLAHWAAHTSPTVAAAFPVGWEADLAAGRYSAVEVAFGACVIALRVAATSLGTTYEAVNVWFFCVIWPLFTLALLGVIVRQRRQLRRLRAATPPPDIDVHPRRPASVGAPQ
jgi:hypothetical protein